MTENLNIHTFPHCTLIHIGTKRSCRYEIILTEKEQKELLNYLLIKFGGE
jgi:hypothetical protein